MYFCPIVPIPHLNELGRCRMALALTHLVGGENDEYRAFFRQLSELGTYVILNNGAYETARHGLAGPTLDETLKRAQSIGAHEIQFPEQFWDGKGTVDAVLGWVSQLDSSTRRQYAWHAVVQGNDYADYVYCFDALSEVDDVDVLGLPKVVTPRCFKEVCGTDDLVVARIYAVAHLVHKSCKLLHLLGLEDPVEVLVQRRWDSRVRSADSSFPIIHAMHGIRYSDLPNSYPVNLPRFDFKSQLPPEVVEIASDNIATVRRWCGEPEEPWGRKSS